MGRPLRRTALFLCAQHGHAAGFYRFERLPAGAYTVTGSRTGYASAETEGVITAGSSSTVDATLWPLADR